MPRHKDDPPGPTKPIYVRIEDTVMERVKNIQKDGLWSNNSEGAFLGHLLKIGLNIYEKRILPLETGNGVSTSEALEAAGHEKQDKDWKEETNRLMALMQNHKNEPMWGFNGPYEHLGGKVGYDTLCEVIRAEGVDPEELLDGTLFKPKKVKGKKAV